MADGDTRIGLDDSRGVSNPGECSPEGSPQKMISDCSDLYDLINFHSSATTQICDDEKNSRRSSSSSSASPVPNKKRDRSSSSSSGHSDGPDSDSGSFARTNGHSEPKDGSLSVDREAVPPASPESAVESCPEERATVPSSVEALSPADSPEPANRAPSPLLILDLGEPLQSPVQELDAAAEVGQSASPFNDDPVTVVLEPVPSLHATNNLLDLWETNAADDRTEGIEVAGVRWDAEPKIVHVEEKTHALTPEKAQYEISDLEKPGLDDEPLFTLGDGSVLEVTMEEVRTEKTSHSDDSGSSEDVQDSAVSHDRFEERHVEESRVFVETVQIVNVVQRTVTSTQTLTDAGDGTENAPLETSQLTQSDVSADDDGDRDLHASASSSDSDSESDRYTPGKKFKQMKTKLVSENTSSSSSISGGTTTTSTTTKKVTEMKVELSTSKSELENGLNAPKKSSFSSSDSVQHQEFSESEGVKIDRNKITRNFSQTNMSEEAASMCRICGKQVFHMERIKAEKGVFHKTCFRCKECGKSLSVDTYCSHEGVLYCRPHFRQLFQPKAKFDEEAIVIPHRRRHEMIIKENIPAELPPDVVRSADKPDYGLDEIPSLKNIKSRFESSETENGHDASLGAVHVKRSESIVSKMAKFQGLESPENGHAVEDSSSSSDEEDADRDPHMVRSSKNKREKVVFSGMSELKSQWETGPSPTKEERARERQEELAKLRLRICHGRGSLKAKYESACEEAIKSPTRHEAADLNGEIRASSIKERFEKGDVSNDNETEKVEKIQREKEEDLSVFKEQGTANDARSLFKQIDASACKTVTSTSPTGNVKRSPSLRSREVLCFQQSATMTDGDIVRASDKMEEDVLAPVDLSSKFKFFENYQDIQGTQERKRFTMTPPREPVKEDSPEAEIVRDPNIVRACDKEEEVVLTNTARTMLSKFRELESKAEREDVPAGPKPLKRITPPREYTKESDGFPELEMARDPNIVRACDKIEDDFLIEAHKARNLKEKFEHWDVLDSDVDRENRKNVEDELLQPSPDVAKNLKAKFEALQEESDRPLEKPKSKINSLILADFTSTGDQKDHLDFGDGANGELCDICGKRVYTMEKLEVNGHKVHKTCFKCSHCQTQLRLENYTTSEGVLYCTPHFKQLFIARGNYDEGFGREQHKDRWNKNSRSPTPNQGFGEPQYVNGDSSD